MQSHSLTRTSVGVALVLAAACAGQTVRTRQPAAPKAVAAATASLPDGTTWVAKSVEYRALSVQAYRAATVRVDAEALRHAPGTWAVILDGDETVLSNLRYQQERYGAGLGFSQESWTAWVRRRAAVPVPGAAAFLAHVHALGGRIAIVTNRLGSECDDTIAVFKANDLVFDAMLCRPDGTPSDKNARFAAVAAGRTDAGHSPLEVIAYLGDNILDFPSLTQAVRETDPAFADFGVRYFVLPNPMYGSWQ
jgi:5'-nucleotidase (lipoprotein e(P4) family)